MASSTSGAMSRNPRPGRTERIHSVIELSKLQLLQVANKVLPEEWTELGVRLGFGHPEIQRLKEQHKKNILGGIYMMLVGWLNFQSDINKTEARKCLSDAFRVIGREDLAGKLKNTVDFFLTPHGAVGDDSFVEFKYNVRSFKPEKDISFQCAMTGNNRPISRSTLIRCAREKKEFRDGLCWCVHLLGVRLRRIQRVTDSPLIFIATAMDEDGVKTVYKMLRDSLAFEDQLKKIVSDYTPSCKAEDINIKLSHYNMQEFEESISFFKDAEYSVSSGAAPPFVSDIELVTLAKELPPDSSYNVGIEIGFEAHDVERFKMQNSSFRAVFEEMLFKWKQRHHPCTEDRTILVRCLENANLRNLAEKIEEGAFRERHNEAQRRGYLKKFSAPCASQSLVRSRFTTHPARPVEPAPPVDHSDVSPSTAVSPSSQTTSTTPSPVCHSPSPIPEPASFSPPYPDIGPLYVNVPNERGRGVPFVVPTSPVSPRYHPQAPKYPPGPEDNISHYEKLADATTGIEEHQYQNLLHRGEEKLRRTFVEPMIPSIYDLELSVLDPFWQYLASDEVTQQDRNTAHGLRKLAVALDKLSQGAIADTIWAALLKDHIQLMYLSTFVTGRVDLRACAINNKQESNVTSLEDLTCRTEELEFPRRIFIQADAEEDRSLIAMKLGCDWASENDSKKPLGNVDLLFMLRVEEIESGSTVGEAILHQCLDCNSPWIESRRVEDFLENANTKVIIVLKCDDESLARLMSYDSSTEERYQKRGLRELVLGEYLPNCIVILTTGPQVVQIRNYAHYKMIPSSSSC